MTAQTFEFATAGRIVFGQGVAQTHLVSLINQINTSKVFVVTGSRSRYADLINALNPVCVFETHSLGEPTIDIAKAAVDQAIESQCDVVVGIGGGTVLDLGKVVAALVTNGGEPMDYIEVVGRGHKITKASLPYIAVPTTAGTGAEVTKNCVLSSPEHNIKASIRASTMIPTVALIDPVLTVTMPPAVTASTGLDALTQNLEPFLSVLANPITDAIAIQGIKYGSRSLLRSFENGSDMEAREDMALCSLFGGIALANAKLGAVHGFAGVLGGMLSDAPHGSVCAVLLPIVIDVNVRELSKDKERHAVMLAKYNQAAAYCTGNEGATAVDMVAWITDLCIKLGVPKLSAYGMKSSDIEMAVEKTYVSSSIKGNSLPLTKNCLNEILTRGL
eukprot:CFRG1250T1